MRFVSFWIIFCAFCNCAGWILSALHQLNAAGYAVAFALGVAVVIGLRSRAAPRERTQPPWLPHKCGVSRPSGTPHLCGSASSSRVLRRWHLRFRRSFPLAFLLLAFFA